MRNLLPATEENIRRAAAIVKGGGVVAFPTETVYGLGADALNPKAVARIFEIKGRPRFDPLIVHVAALEDVERLAKDVPEEARTLMERFWPGPLTLVLPKRETVPPITTAGLPTVAIRMPAHPVALKLIRYACTPVAAPSANPFGYVSPTTARQVAETLGDRVDMILDAGKTPIGVESTIIMFSGGEVYLLRPGGLPVEEIERVLGRKVKPYRGKGVPAPGTLKKHYSPRTRVVILRDWGDYYRLRARYGRVLLVLPRPVHGIEGDVRSLSGTGDPKEVAANLFSTLYEADRLGYDVIAVMPVPEEGLGRAIMNRLRKAAAE